MTEFDPWRWQDDLDGFLAWARENWTAGQMWCPEHWSPAPVEGRNGLLAQVRLMEAVLALMPADVLDAGTFAMNAWSAAHLPLCCLLGDDAMAAIWGGCPVTRRPE